MDFHEFTGQQWDEDLRRLRTRLAWATAFLAGIFLVGTVGYRLIAPGTSWVDAFYMTAITLTTVGFGEIVQLEGNPAGRLFTAGLALFGMGGVLYFLSTATAFVLEGQLGHVFWRRRMEKRIADLADHLVVCGSGATAVYAVEELAAVERDVVLVSDEPERIQGIRPALDEEIPRVVGDPASDDVLREAGIERAAGLVACADDDKENLVITLSARQLNPDLRIVSRIGDVGTLEKARKTGADSVVSPDHIGALRLASELIRPTVVDFLDEMLRDRDLNLRIDEVTVPGDSSATGRTLDEVRPEGDSNALLLAVRTEDGEWIYNPPPSHEIRAGQGLVFLGSPADARAVRDRVDGEMVARPAPEGA